MYGGNWSEVITGFIDGFVTGFTEGVVTEIVTEVVTTIVAGVVSRLSRGVDVGLVMAGIVFKFGKLSLQILYVVCDWSYEVVCIDSCYYGLRLVNCR